MHFALRFYIQKARPFVDKYGSKHTGSRTIVQAKIGGTYGQMRTDGVNTRRNKRSIHTRRQKREGKDTRTVRSNDKTYLWYELIS